MISGFCVNTLKISEYERFFFQSMKNFYFITEKKNVKGKRLFSGTVLIIFYMVMQFSYLHRSFRTEFNLNFHQKYNTVKGITE